MAVLVAWFMVVHEILDTWNETTVTLDLMGSKVDSHRLQTLECPVIYQGPLEDEATQQTPAVLLEQM